MAICYEKTNTYVENDKTEPPNKYKNERELSLKTAKIRIFVWIYTNVQTSGLCVYLALVQNRCSQTFFHLFWRFQQKYEKYNKNLTLPKLVYNCTNYTYNIIIRSLLEIHVFITVRLINAQNSLTNPLQKRNIPPLSYFSTVFPLVSC